MSYEETLNKLQEESKILISNLNQLAICNEEQAQIEEENVETLVEQLESLNIILMRDSANVSLNQSEQYLKLYDVAVELVSNIQSAFVNALDRGTDTLSKLASDHASSTEQASSTNSRTSSASPCHSHVTQKPNTPRWQEVLLSGRKAQKEIIPKSVKPL